MSATSRDPTWIGHEFDRRPATYDQSETHRRQADQAVTMFTLCNLAPAGTLARRRLDSGVSERSQRQPDPRWAARLIKRTGAQGLSRSVM